MDDDDDDNGDDDDDDDVLQKENEALVALGTRHNRAHGIDMKDRSDDAAATCDDHRFPAVISYVHHDTGLEYIGE